ncbi:MAG: hypothetical protein ACPG77_09905 [Nannocystaceae bacterium]
MGDKRDHSDDHGDKKSRGGPDFLDLELSKVLMSEASGVTREAFRDLLKDAAKARFQERYGDQIQALANLAVDELLADMATNLAIESQIADREQRRRDVGDQARACLTPASEANPETGDTDG